MSNKKKQNHLLTCVYVVDLLELLNGISGHLMKNSSLNCTMTHAWSITVALWLVLLLVALGFTRPNQDTSAWTLHVLPFSCVSFPWVFQFLPTLERQAAGLKATSMYAFEARTLDCKLLKGRECCKCTICKVLSKFLVLYTYLYY